MPVAPPPPDWICVAGGEFTMGGGPRPEENPAHRVRLPAFAIARTPVSRDLYRAFLEATGHQAPTCWTERRFRRPGIPAVGPSWHDAVAFCRWASGQWGREVRLPTEAEWERAAKADREVVYPWGDAEPEMLDGYFERWHDGPEPIDAYPSQHPWGIVGLGENVHEWCLDWYDAEYYLRSPEAAPCGPPGGRRRAARGGAWRHRIKVSRCAARSSLPPDFQYNDFGFRLVSPSS